MRRFIWGFAVLLTVQTAAFAQTTESKPAEPAEAPRWDLNFSVGLFSGRPEEGNPETYDDWYSEGRYAVGVGYFWTENFKTEIEFAHSPEGSRYVQEFFVDPSRDQSFPFSYEKYHRVQHTSVRAVWQFFDNAWVHPYVNGGFVLEAERHRFYVPPQYRFPPTAPPGTSPPVPVVMRPEFRSEEVTDYRGGVTAGGGAKFYVSPSAYINAGVQVTYARPSTTVSFLAGFGIDF